MIIRCNMRDGEKVHTSSVELGEAWRFAYGLPDIKVIALALTAVSKSCARAAKLAR